MKKLVALFVLMSSMVIAQPGTRPSYDNINQLNDDDEREGLWIDYHAGGTIHTLKQYVDGELNGLSIRMTEHGQLLSQEHYQNDVLHGPQRYYDNLGRLERELTYIEGVKDGIETEYYIPEGRVKSRTTWSMGERDGTVDWYYPEGVVSASYPYRQGKIEGKVEFYHLNGEIKILTDYVNNERHGDHEERYEDGSKKVVGAYDHGDQAGTWYYYDEEGNLERTREFRPIRE